MNSIGTIEQLKYGYFWIQAVTNSPLAHVSFLRPHLLK